MLLSSIRRIRTHVMGAQSEPLAIKNENDRLLKSWMITCSNMVEKYIDRSILKTTYTEYFTVAPTTRIYWLKAIPIVTLTDVYTDPTGEWEGDESEVTDCFMNEYASAVCMPFGYNLLTAGPNSLRIRYTGGLAAHAVDATYIISATGYTGTFTVDSFVFGSSSGAVGIVKSYTALTRALVVENYYGQFTVGETLSQTMGESAGAETASGVIESVSIPSLCDVAPDIIMACEMQVRYMWKHTSDFEVIGTDKDGLTSRDSRLNVPHLPLLPEVREILNPYKRMQLL